MTKPVATKSRAAKSTRTTTTAPAPELRPASVYSPDFHDRMTRAVDLLGSALGDLALLLDTVEPNGHRPELVALVTAMAQHREMHLTLEGARYPEAAAVLGGYSDGVTS